MPIVIIVISVWDTVVRFDFELIFQTKKSADAFLHKRLIFLLKNSAGL